MASILCPKVQQALKSLMHGTPWHEDTRLHYFS